MSRITKWKIEKTKVKVVFRLQFHATHIPQSGWDKLFISFIPLDSGKATAKTTKATVRNGTCKWADPIYETTRLLQDIKTRQYEEKLYKLVVGMGSSRSSILGEANIDLADFVDALKPIVVALPLNGSEAGTTLHVTVQLLTSKTGFREFEQQRELRERGLQTTSDQGTPDESADSKESSPDQNVNNHINKVSARVKLKKESKELPRVSSLEGEAGVSEEYADLAVGVDGSSTTSESIYTEKHDMSSTHEEDSLKSTVSGDLGGLSLSESAQPEKGDAPDCQFPSRGSDWVHGWSINYSPANNLVAASEDSNSSKLKGNLEAVESSILDLKLEVSSLQNHADEIGVETQKFAEQLAAEISLGEELAKEVAVLKSECSKFKDDFEQFKSSKLSLAHTTREPTETDQAKLFQKLQLKWLKGLLLMEDKLRDVRKVSMEFPERDVRVLNSELEALVEILLDLKQEFEDAISGTNAAKEGKEMDLCKDEQFLTGVGSDAGLFQPEGMAHYLTIPGLVSHESDSIDPTLAMKGKIFELLRELDESKTERESLVRKMDQMECYYEALIQELEQSQRQMMAELQNLRNEHSTCLYTISSGKTEMERMHQNMNEQLMKFAEDKCILDSLNNELERRAISAEAALKRARLNYSIAVGQLQKDLELLSFQVLSMHETNENLIKQTFSDSSLPNPDGCPEPVKYPKNSEGNTSDRLLCQNQSSALSRQNLGEDILLSDLKRSLQLQEGLYKQVEEEICQMHFVNIYSDVFSKALQETLLEASLDIRLMKEEIDHLSRQLQLTNESKELLVLRLQNAMNNIHSLDEYNEILTAKSNDIAHQNQLLEANLKDLAHENNILTQKNNELEALLTAKSNDIAYQSQLLEANLKDLTLENNLLTQKNNELEALLTAKSNDIAHQIQLLEANLKDLALENNLLTQKNNELEALLTAKSNDIAHQRQLLESNLKDLDHENNLLTQKNNELEALLTEYGSYKGKYMACSAENLDIKNLLKTESLENSHLHDQISILQEELKAIRTKFDELASMKDNLQNNVSFLLNKLQKLLASYDDKYDELSPCSRSACLDSESKDLVGLLLHLEELQQSACDRIQLLIEEKKVLVNEKHMAQVSLNTAESDILLMKQKFKHDLQEMVSNISVSSALLQKLQLEFEVIVGKINAGSEAEEIYSQHHKEFLSGLDCLEAELQQLNSRNQELAQEIIRLDTLSTDLEMCKMTFAAVTEEKEALELSLQDKTEGSAKISSELKLLKESFHSLHDELRTERTLRQTLEKTVTDLTTELNEKQCQLQDSDSNRQELVRLKQLVTDLELENSRVSDLLLKSEERLKDALRESSSISCLETHFSELHEFSIATDVLMTFTRMQLEGHIEKLSEKLHSTCRQLEVLHKKNLKAESELNGCLCRELTYIEENTRLLTDLDSLKSELGASTAQSRALTDQNSATVSELEEQKSRAENGTNTFYVHEGQCVLEVARLEHLLESCSGEVEDLFFCKEEAELKCIVLQAKLDELETAMTSLKQSEDELIRLHSQCNELTKRLSEQVFKTEEFKNLSIHLKELKDKAEAECLNARDGRGHVGPPVAMQESLRIAFIKEQYETKLQELKQQLSLSKKHSEEMLWKLQDAVDDTENRKKCEASHIKRNEELGMKILDLEAELQAVLSDKRNLLNAYDLLKAEKECSVMTLECCKQEKQELEASLLKCNEEKSKIEAELTLAKELCETLRSHVNVLNEGNDTLKKKTCPSDEPLEGKLLDRNSISDNEAVGSDISACSQEPESANLPTNRQPEESLAFRGINGCQNLETEEDLQQNEEKKHMALTERLKSSMAHLNKELERMKNENLLPPADDDSYEPSSPGLQRELMRLHEANQELGNIFPMFNEICAGGNALERVLALEIELAEALLAKKKSSIQFQSSFLKQHSDEEAVFRSFRDINELIKYMLEIKARHSAVETELKEMHDRYSQLSLQFAEVEGERQKLMMTLKNNRASKMALNSPTFFGDHSL